MANQISHCYNRLPLLPSGPGGVRQELVVPICRVKVKENLIQYKEQSIKAEYFKVYYRYGIYLSYSPFGSLVEDSEEFISGYL